MIELYPPFNEKTVLYLYFERGDSYRFLHEF